MIIDLNKQKNTIILLFFYSLSILIALLTFQDFGIHIEEKYHRLNGHYWLNYISKIFGFTGIQNITEIKINQIYDYTLSSVSTYNKYSILFDLPAALFEILFKIENVRDVYYLKHILSFFIFLLSSFFFFKVLLIRYRNFNLSFLGLVLYVTTPRILGDSFLYKDVLFLSILMFAIYYLIKSINSQNLKYIILFSLFSALSVNLRLFAILIPIFFIFFIIIKNFDFGNYKKNISKLLLYFFSFLFFLFIFWPYLWSDPISNFFNLFNYISNDGKIVKLFYNNDYISNNTLHDTYILNWIILTSPFLQTILFFLGFFYCFFRLIRRYINIKKNSIHNNLWRGKQEEIDFIFLIFLILFYFFFVFFNAPLYNGWRLVYFFNIFLIYFSINFLFNIKKVFFNKNLNKLIISFIFLFLMTYNIYAVIKTHPFQSLYFNSLLSPQIKNSFEGDYYGIGSKHFFEEFIQKDSRKVIKIGVASHTPLQRGLEGISKDLQKKIIIVGQEYDQADYIFKNNISEVNSKLIKKYQIPKNFSKVYQLKIDKIIIYEVYKLTKS